ncbi:MAG: hypothetical protein ACYC6T_11660 [Thermoleophilia bacterium]
MKHRSWWFLGRILGLGCTIALAALLTGCATPALDASTTAGEQAPLDTTTAPGPVPAEDLRRAVLSAIDALGPARVHIEIVSEFPPELLPESSEEGESTGATGFGADGPWSVDVDLLVDRRRHLALETRRLLGTTFRTGVVGRTVRTVTTMAAEEGQPPWIAVNETILREPAQGIDWPDQLLFSASPRTLEISKPVSAARRADGSAELVLRVPQDPFRDGMIGMFTLWAGGEARLTVGPDNLPRELVMTTRTGGDAPSGPSSSSEAPGADDSITQRATYRIEPVSAVTEADVRVDVPADAEIYRMVELSLEHPRPDFPWPAYWLGPSFGGQDLIDAIQQTDGFEGPESVGEEVVLVYGPAGSSWYGNTTGENSVSVRQVRRDAAAAFAWSFEGQPSQERVVAGRMATVRVGDASSEGSPWVGVLVEFPDVAVVVDTYGAGVTAEEILAALQAL